jgi:hypothetical protein
MGKGAIRLAGFIAASLVGIGACGNDHGPGPYAAIGAPCRNDFDCGGIFCVDFGGGTCQVACRSDVDCGPGYRCHSESRRGTGGNVEVCVPN